MRRVRALTALLTVAGILFGAAGCGPPEADAGNDRLTYWAVSMGASLEENERLLDQELAKFTEETGIEVDLEVLDWTVLYTRIMTAVAGGPRPDVLNIGCTWSPTLQDTGEFLAFDDEAMDAIGGKDRFIATTLASTGAPGEPPASIPYLGQAFALYYNTAMFAEAGITEPPATWAEFVADAKTLTHGDQWGVSLNGASPTSNAHLSFLLGRQHGSELFNADGRPQFDTSAQRDAVGRLIDLMDTDGVVSPSDAEQSGITDPLAALADGRAAMIFNQASARGHLAEMGFEDYAVAPMPVVDPLPEGGVPMRSFVAGTNLAIFEDTTHREDALELVRFLTSDEEQVVLNEAFHTLPVVPGAYDDPAFSDPGTQLFGTILSQDSETMPMVPAEGQMEQLLGAAVTQLWAKAATGEVTDDDIAAALKDATSQMEATP